jgi:hypothetical protein
MNDTFHCADHEALVAYLYDECEPADRAAIAAHAAHCAACAEELASLRATRTQLASWTPPAAALGFQITRADGHNEPLAFTARDGRVGAASPGASAPRPSRWREPLPAWAQAAAAALIFAAGLTAGTLGNSSARDTVATATTASPAAIAPPARIVAVAQPASSASAVSVTDLARLEQRLRDLESELESTQEAVSSARSVSAAAVVRGIDEQAILKQVDARVAESEARLQNAVAVVTAAARTVDAQYRELVQPRNRVRSVTAEDLERNRESRDLLATPVAFPGRFGR